MSIRGRWVVSLGIDRQVYLPEYINVPLSLTLSKSRLYQTRRHVYYQPNNAVSAGQDPGILHLYLSTNQQRSGFFTQAIERDIVA